MDLIDGSFGWLGDLVSSVLSFCGEADLLCVVCGFISQNSPTFCNYGLAASKVATLDGEGYNIMGK